MIRALHGNQNRLKRGRAQRCRYFMQGPGRFEGFGTFITGATIDAKPGLCDDRAEEA
jgi:hypothetical protein